jgi:hypothetical protein
MYICFSKRNENENSHCKGSLNTIIMKCWKKWQDVCMKSLRVKAATAGELNITEGFVSRLQ